MSEPSPVFKPERTRGDVPRSRFRRGRTKPKGVVWFGVTSFWGHLRHFLASAIATEDVDSRDWMTPDEPSELVARIAERLGGRGTGESLGECLERELWIDFVADTGDDVEVSERVAELICAEYELPDPETPGRTLRAPRGELLLFGGDTAYPVATGEEINNRVMVPFNRVLRDRDDGVARVLLGIPGNHDWYDGLDGFARMFRVRPDQDDDLMRPSVMNIDHGIERYADWAREFVKGGHIDKPKTLNLLGYAPAQSASYFVLPLTPKIHLFAVDRQLKRMDFRQRRFFADWRQTHPEVCPWVVLPDPPFKFGEPASSGMLMIRALDIHLGRECALVMTGDVHHYERWREGATHFVTAGGGGAFLHPARVYRREQAPREREWPGPRQSARLLMQVPWKVARGRSGFIPHLVYASMFVPQIWIALGEPLRVEPLLLATAIVFLITTIVYSLIGGVRRGRRALVSAVAALTGLFTALSPLAVSLLVTDARAALGLELSRGWQVAFASLICSFASAFVFGGYLSLLTRVGLEHTQAFTALDHPGFKHFLRLRVRPHEDRIDGWCLGLMDPLARDARPELVDQFSFSPRHSDAENSDG